MPVRALATRLQGASKIFTALTTAVADTPADGLGFATTGREAIALYAAVLAGTQGTIEVHVQEADTDVDASYADVAAKDLEFPINGRLSANGGTVTFAGAANSIVDYVGYKGSKAFVRVELLNAAGVPDFAIVTGVVANRQRHINGTQP